MKKINKRQNTLGLVMALLVLLAALATGFGQDEAGDLMDVRPYRLVIGDDFIAAAYVPLDEALEPAGEPLPPLLVSADGSTGVKTIHTAGRANPDPRKTWVVVRDITGEQGRGRFHPPMGGLVGGLSADGSRLLWQPFPPLSTYPPPVDWYVLASADGSVVAHIRDDGRACFRQSAILDNAGERLYCVDDPTLDSQLATTPLRIVAYDVAREGRVAELELPEMLVGVSAVTDDGGFMQTIVEPAVVLSPDGRRLAVVDAGSERIVLIDTAGLAVERWFTPRPTGSLWDWLGLGVDTAAAKGMMRGTIRHAAFSDDGRFLYVYSQILPAAGGEAPDVRGLVVVDLDRERVAAEALADYQIQWVLPAPDGSVYAFGTTEPHLFPYEIRDSSPSMLWRLDGRTLAVLAERAFEGYRMGRVVGGG